MAAAIAAAVPLHAESHVRNGWCAGIGFGSGFSNVSWEGAQRDVQWSGTVTARAGYATKQNVVVAVEFEGWSKNYSLVTFQGDIPVDMKLSGTTLGVVYFPGNQGFLIKGGMGVAVTQIDVTPDPSITFPTRGKFTDTGPAVLVGVGYEFRVTRTFALAIEFDSHYLGVKGEGIANVFNYGGGAAFNWYW